MNILLGIRRDVPYPRIEDTGYRFARKSLSRNRISFPGLLSVLAIFVSL